MRQSAFLVFFSSISWPTNTWNCFQGLLSQTRKMCLQLFLETFPRYQKKVLRLSLENAYCSIVISVFTLNFEKAIICVFFINVVLDKYVSVRRLYTWVIKKLFPSKIIFMKYQIEYRSKHCYKLTRFKIRNSYWNEFDNKIRSKLFLMIEK